MEEEENLKIKGTEDKIMLPSPPSKKKIPDKKLETGNLNNFGNQLLN